MHGPPLTAEEVKAILSRKVTSLEAAGLPTAEAIRVAAVMLNVDPQKVALLLGEPVDLSLQNVWVTGRTANDAGDLTWTSRH